MEIIRGSVLVAQEKENTKLTVVMSLGGFVG